MVPPLAGRALLRLFVPVRDHDYVAGDLLEEYLTIQLPRYGARSARRWYLGQALRSIWPMVVLRLRRGELAVDLLAAQVLVLGVCLGLHVVWRTVLSLVPLRAAGLAPGFELASVVVVATVSALAAYVHGAVRGPGTQSPLAFPAAVCIAAAMGRALVDVPLFVAAPAVFAALACGALLGSCLVRRQPRPVARRLA